MEDRKSRYTDRVRRRFANTPELSKYLPVLSRFSFSYDKLVWMYQADIDAVKSFCERIMQADATWSTPG